MSILTVDAHKESSRPFCPSHGDISFRIHLLQASIAFLHRLHVTHPEQNCVAYHSFAPMDMLSNSSIACISSSTKSLFPRLTSIPCPPKILPRRTPSAISVLKASSRPVCRLVEEDVFQMFLRERKLNGDFVSKVSDVLWHPEILNFVDYDAGKLAENPQEAEQVTRSNNDDGYLKLSRTQEWILGNKSAPMNKKAIVKALQDDSEKRKKLNLLKYGALKRELMLLSVSIGTACSIYCLVVLSFQAAISYAVGALFSCLYLQLLYQHTDGLSKEMVPQIFMQKKSKRIGIRSEDLRDSLEKSVKGSGLALSSPRLVIPAAIYGLWALSHNYFGNEFFDFQLVPAMFGMLVYKAAALVQVYRDNEDLQLVFPENEQGSSD